MSLIKNIFSETVPLQTIVPLDENNPESFSFSLLQLKQSSFHLQTQNQECAVLLIQGDALATFHGEQIHLQRTHWKEENPSVFHLCKNEELHLKSDSNARFAIITTHNAESFSSHFYSSQSVTTEHRGKDILNDTCYRLVRTVFDYSSAPKEAKLVLGEVMNFPGRWSSYPPHHHDQEEIYYYEFDSNKGFGFAQCGDEIHKISHQDLLHIPGGNDHSQVSAPGYFLYYIWAIRHGAKPYTGFTYTKPYDEVLKM
jgi:5-deoxy-glucuronate isomerase